MSRSMKNIVRCSSDDYSTLAAIWERSVRATHGFLSHKDLDDIKDALIPDYFPLVDLYAAVRPDGAIVGFTGLREEMIEMLFVDSDNIGRGYGSALLDFAMRNGATKVDVNEQNISALFFYQAKGFHVLSREETDDAGRPYPILHLSL